MEKDLIGRRSALRRAINRYRDAYEADSWKGGGDPDDYPAIEKRLERTEAAMKALIKKYIS